MNELPILFSEPMVRAILDGRKTRTRRIAKWPKSGRWPKRGPGPERLDNLGDCETVVATDLDGKQFYVACPYGGEGDRLWVRERHHLVVIGGRCSGNSSATFPDGGQKYRDGAYYVPGQGLRTEGLKWRPSIHMPRWACRLVLDVVEDPDLQRISEISDEDALAEGIYLPCGHSLYTWDQRQLGGGRTPREAFLALFALINGEDAVRTNPWVWVVKFRPGAPW